MNLVHCHTENSWADLRALVTGVAGLEVHGTVAVVVVVVVAEVDRLLRKVSLIYCRQYQSYNFPNHEKYTDIRASTIMS